MVRFVGTAVFAGFSGVELDSDEPQRQRPRDTKGTTHRALDRSGVELSSFTFIAQWRDDVESPEERKRSDQLIELASSFPGARLVLEQARGVDRSDLRSRQNSAIRCVNSLGHRAASAGVAVTFHPDSAPGSVFRDADDYDRLLTGLNPGAGYTPDLWHITQGGMDPLETIFTYRDRIDHVRLGAAGEADTTGLAAGDTERARVVAYLCHTGFAGWFVVDAEGSAPGVARESAIRTAGRYAGERLAPLVREAQRARAANALVEGGWSTQRS